MKIERLRSTAKTTLTGLGGVVLAAGVGFGSPAVAQEEIDVSIVSGFSPAVAAVPAPEDAPAASGASCVPRPIFRHKFNVINA